MSRTCLVVTCIVDQKIRGLLQYQYCVVLNNDFLTPDHEITNASNLVFELLIVGLQLSLKLSKVSAFIEGYLLNGLIIFGIL